MRVLLGIQNLRGLEGIEKRQSNDPVRLENYCQRASIQSQERGSHGDRWASWMRQNYYFAFDYGGDKTL